MISRRSALAAVLAATVAPHVARAAEDDVLLRLLDDASWTRSGGTDPFKAIYVLLPAGCSEASALRETTKRLDGKAEFRFLVWGDGGEADDAVAWLALTRNPQNLHAFLEGRVRYFKTPMLRYVAKGQTLPRDGKVDVPTRLGFPFMQGLYKDAQIRIGKIDASVRRISGEGLGCPTLVYKAADGVRFVRKVPEMEAFDAIVADAAW